jgi:integrase
MFVTSTLSQAFGLTQPELGLPRRNICLTFVQRPEEVFARQRSAMKPAGKKLGMPWLNWHTLRRTHITLFQVVGGSLRDAQAQLGHSKMSTTLEIYTLPIPEQQRITVEKLSVLMANDGEFAQNREDLPLAS